MTIEKLKKLYQGAYDNGDTYKCSIYADMLLSKGLMVCIDPMNKKIYLDRLGGR